MKRIRALQKRHYEDLSKVGIAHAHPEVGIIVLCCIVYKVQLCA